MNYTIDIIDTENADVDLTLEKAERGSIQLNWNGSDAKDELVIVGSNLSFTMLDPNYIDGCFDRFFTGNETRFLTRLYTDDGTTIWSGFLLPDSYSEPYRNGNITVDFTAADGLGRLKGKYLSEYYYTEEVSVIQVISACLLKTGLTLDLYFTPAIENSLEKSYNAIYLEGNLFTEGESRDTCYVILEKLLADLLCCVYQCDNRWYVDALNKRQMRTITYVHYTAIGEYVGEVALTRLLKESKPLATPNITMVPPYGEIKVTHEQQKQTLPETINNEANDGWAVLNGVNGEIYATDWNGNNGFYAKAVVPNYVVGLPVIWGDSDDYIDKTKFVDLRKKLYVVKGAKFTFKITIESSISGGLPENLDTFDQNGTICEVIIDGDIVNTFSISFSKEEGGNKEEVEIAFDVVAQRSGVMDIKLYQPYGAGAEGYGLTYFDYFLIKEIEFNQVGFEDVLISEDVVNEDYTEKKEIELVYSDDKRGIGSAFRLAKLNDASEDYNEVVVPIQYGFTQNNINYSVLQLDGANLISDNIKFVYYNDVLLPDLEVIYNYDDGEQMVVKTNILLDSGNFIVRIYATNAVAEDRTYWEQWTDSVYKIETNRYIDCVANINRRMFNVPHYKIDMTVNQSLKFNDIITFPYKLIQNYFLSNCTWHVDLGETTVTAIKGYYKNDIVVNPDDNIQPIVEVQSSISIAEGITSVNVDATAYDPDGFIVSYLWEQISGDTTAIIATPTTEDTLITGLTGDNYTFRITVTDNEGGTGSADVLIQRVKTYIFSLSQDCVSAKDDTWPLVVKRKLATLNVSPAIANGTTLNVSVRAVFFDVEFQTMYLDGEPYGDLSGDCDELIDSVFGVSGVVKNGVATGDFTQQEVSFNMIAGDLVRFQLEAQYSSTIIVTNYTNINYYLEVYKIEDVNGVSIVEGLPLKIYAFDDWIDL